MIKGILNALAISAFVYAWIAVWFSLTAFVVLIIVSMLCLIGAERVRRGQQRERDKLRHPSVWVPEPDGDYPGSAVVFDTQGWR